MDVTEIGSSLVELSPERLTALRKFGLILGTAFGLLTGFLFWRERPTAPVFLAISIFFFTAGIFMPKILDRIEVYWMAFAEKLSVVATFIILTITFIFAITPLGLLLRLMGKDLLSLKLDKNAATYWVPVPADAPGTRPYLPY